MRGELNVVRTRYAEKEFDPKRKIVNIERLASEIEVLAIGEEIKQLVSQIERSALSYH